MGYSCENAINRLSILRIIITIICIYFLSVSINISFINNNLLLILPIILILLDKLDNIETYYSYSTGKSDCSTTFDYQIKDKAVDLFSYFLIYFSFPLDIHVLYLILFRSIGVLLFFLTKSSYWLVVFFDFIKEYLIYIFIFKEDFSYIPFAMIGKILFEYIFHTKLHKNQY
jgi:hypothetical protein